MSGPSRDQHPSSRQLPPGQRVFDQVLSAIINALLSVPPIRFVMGLVGPRWRPLWAALWIAVIIYLLSRAMNQLALRRARLRLASEVETGRASAVPPLLAEVDRGREGPPAPAVARSAAARDPAPPDARPLAPERRSVVQGVPLPVVAGALVVGAMVVVGVARLTRPSRGDARDSLAATGTVPAVDTKARPEAPIAIRWRSGRADNLDCIGTFEVTHGPGTRARLVAFAMDSSGAVIARDSTQMNAAVTGMFVDFRFRNVDCGEIDDWQIQATTSNPRPQ